MSSSYDAGKTADDALKTQQTKCPKSPNGEHAWEKHGQWPSTWEECRHCKIALFWK